jgi:hypothetical protein
MSFSPARDAKVLRAWLKTGSHSNLSLDEFAEVLRAFVGEFLPDYNKHPWTRYDQKSQVAAALGEYGRRLRRSRAQRSACNAHISACAAYSALVAARQNAPSSGTVQ